MAGIVHHRAPAALSLLLARACGCGSEDPMPPATWKEHWFEHVQDVSLVHYDGHVAVYFDAQMNVESSEWLFDFISKTWQYSKQTYGCMGSDLLYAIFHQGKYSGGHPSYYYDKSHDYRNVSDQGTTSSNGWSEGNYDVASHEVVCLP